jgi:hypothetical protein
MVVLGIVCIVLCCLWYFGEQATGTIWSALDAQRRWRPLAWIILAPGVATHEAAHALAALATGAGVQKFVPFHPVRTEDGWQFGYVQPGPSSHMANGVIAMAPLWLTPLLVYGAGAALTGVSGIDIWNAMPWATPLAWLWLYWLVSVSLANMPSRPDFVAARPLLAGLALCLALFVGLCISGQMAIDPTPCAEGVLAMIVPQAIIVLVLTVLSKTLVGNARTT